MNKASNTSLDKINIVGDRVLIKPRKESGRSASGLYLPPGVKEKEKIKYIPLQVREGDLAVFLQGSSYEIIYQGDKYFIVPQSSILMIERDEELFN